MALVCSVLSRGRKPSWTAWWVTEKAPEITAWLAMIVAAVAMKHQRQPRPVRRHQVEGVLDRRRVAEQQRALAEIIEHQAGIDEAEPGEADRLAPEMAHVGIERLGAGHGEEHRAHGEEGELRIVGEEFDRPVRAQRAEDLGMRAGCSTTPSAASAAK